MFIIGVAFYVQVTGSLEVESVSKQRVEDEIWDIPTHTLFGPLLCP